MRKSVIDYMLFSCSAVMAGRAWGSGVRKAEIYYMLFSCRAVMAGGFVDLGKWCEEGCNRLHVV